MNTCTHELNPHGNVSLVCGQPLQGRGPCATCSGYGAAFAHGSFVGLVAKNGHAYVPSEYACEVGHVSKSAQSAGDRSTPADSAHVEHV